MLQLFRVARKPISTPILRLLNSKNLNERDITTGSFLAKKGFEKLTSPRGLLQYKSYSSPSSSKTKEENQLQELKEKVEKLEKEKDQLKKKEERLEKEKDQLNKKEERLEKEKDQLNKKEERLEKEKEQLNKEKDHLIKGGNFHQGNTLFQIWKDQFEALNRNMEALNYQRKSIADQSLEIQRSLSLLQAQPKVALDFDEMILELNEKFGVDCNNLPDLYIPPVPYFVGREPFDRHLNSWLENFQKQNVISRDTCKIPIATGATGLGKTTGLNHIGQLALEGKLGDKVPANAFRTLSGMHPVPVVVSFNGGTQFQKGDDPLQGLFARLYLQMFVGDQTKLPDLKAYFQYVRTSSESLDLVKLLKFYQAAKKIDRALFILLIDEIQHAFSEMPMRSDSPFNLLSTSLMRCLSSSDNTFAAVPFFAGTLTTPLANLLSYSSVHVDSLPLNLLTSKEDREEVAKGVLGLSKEENLPEALLPSLHILGIHPRSLWRILEGWKMFQDPDSAWLKAFEAMGQLHSPYSSSSFSEKDAFHLFSIYLEQIAVTRADVLCESQVTRKENSVEERVTVEDLEKNGRIWLSQSENVLRLHVPFIFLSDLGGLLNKKLPELNHFIQRVDPRKIGYGFETAYFHFLALRLGYLREKARDSGQSQTASVQEIFKSAVIEGVDSGLRLMLPTEEVKVKQSDFQVPEQPGVISHFSSRQNQPGVDGAILLKTEDGRNVYFFLQPKHIKDSASTKFQQSLKSLKSVPLPNNGTTILVGITTRSLKLTNEIRQFSPNIFITNNQFANHAGVFAPHLSQHFLP